MIADQDLLVCFISAWIGALNPIFSDWVYVYVRIKVLETMHSGTPIFLRWQSSVYCYRQWFFDYLLWNESPSFLVFVCLGYSPARGVVITQCFLLHPFVYMVLGASLFHHFCACARWNGILYLPNLIELQRTVIWNCQVQADCSLGWRNW